MNENWLPVVGFEGKYSISDHGQVRNDRRGTILTGSLKRGRRRISLWGDDGSITYVEAHILVLEAFVSPRPAGLQGLHWDDNADNNVLSNLRWGTPSDNVYDQVRNGRHSRANRTHCINGHSYDAINTYIRPNGRRACKECKSIEQKRNQPRRRQKRREASIA
jgi:hypothetical protein